MENNTSKIEITKDLFEVIGMDASDAEKISRPSMTYLQDAWRRFKQNKLALFSAILLLVIIIMTLVGPSLSAHEFDFVQGDLKNLKPNGQFWFGSDSLGRDIFARVWIGGRVSIAIGLSCTLIMTVVGSIYGGIAGYFGGIVDDIMMRVVEIVSSMPYLVLVILITLICGKEIIWLILAMSLTSWCSTSRIVRGQLLQVREQEFVLAAQTLGASPTRVITKHLLPNALGVLLVDITLSVPGFIFSEAFLSYIGLGVQSPNTSWGAMASQAQGQLMFYPYQLFFPCLLISLVMFCFQILGDGLNDALDPRLRQ
ncbi:MAG: ABC transporter permease [Clostridium sp.]